MINFENEFGTVSYDEELKIISLIFKRQTPLEHFIPFHEKFLESFLLSSEEINS